MINQLLLIIACITLLCSCGISGKEEIPRLDADMADMAAETVHEAVYRKISADEAYDMMLLSKNYVLLDVRTEEEYEEQRIDGAVLLPDYEIADNAESVLSDKEALIFVYCRSGRRSADASNELVGMRYTNVYDFGGIIDWPYETISG